MTPAGHEAGDAVLSEAASFLVRSVRAEDFVCRYGGEEFALLLPETNLQGALPYAERMRQEIEQHRFEPAEDEILELTVSGGIAAYPEIAAESVDELLRKADEALYRAKGNGRNRIESAEK